MPHVRVTVEGGIGELVLDRPKVNAMSRELLREMRAGFTELAQDQRVRGVLVRGAGRCLSAGLDLVEVSGLDHAAAFEFLDEFDAAFFAAFSFPKPMAAVVHGHAIAGGLVLALCADFVAFATGDYKVGLTELAVGVPFPRVAFEIVQLASPPRAFSKLVNEALVYPPEEVHALGVGDVLVGDAEAAARRWLDLVTGRPAATFAHVKATRRRDAWARCREQTLAERRALADAILGARDTVRGAVP
jgi:enoyl-CoA hydratase/carnithine racemase